jgi:putative membrane protein
VRFLKLIFILLIMMIGAAFAVMNAEAVRLNYYFGVEELPLSVILVAALALGAIL